jgi:hypothetical protein
MHLEYLYPAMMEMWLVWLPGCLAAPSPQRRQARNVGEGPGVGGKNGDRIKLLKLISHPA